MTVGLSALCGHDLEQCSRRAFALQCDLGGKYILVCLYDKRVSIAYGVAIVCIFAHG
jgi:hypothetical protein